MRITYKQKCSRCKKNFVLVTWKNRFPLCYECQKNDLSGEIKDPEMKKLLNLPEEYYKESSFLRSIKINYLKFGTLSEKQIEFFKKAVQKMKEEREHPKVVQEPIQFESDVSLRSLRKAQKETKAKKSKKVE